MADNEFNTGRRGFGLLNLLALLLVLGAVAVVVGVAIIVLSPDNPLSDLLGVEEEAPLPTLALAVVGPEVVIPTDTPEPTPTRERSVDAQVPPTNTPLPIRAPATQRPAATLRPTLTPSVTPILPSRTPTPTPTPTPTNTPTPGPSATATSTRSLFPFTKDLVSPQYLQNFANAAGCNWLGIAGGVFDLSDNPVPLNQYQVHVWDGGVDQRVMAGASPAYGPSGFEVYIFNQPRVQDHNIQLETINGTPVSQVYRVQTRASCNQNLLMFDFIQNH